MSKAREYALDICPYGECPGNEPVHMDRRDYRELIEDSYKQGEIDAIKRACDYLYKHRQGNRNVYEFIGLFRVFMEEGI